MTGGGGEYSFFTKIGITHMVSCPHAHQQNGAAERKHRHIVEVGLSLLAQAHMPLKYWDEAFLAATFLINRTPSKVIQYVTPLERLYDVKPDYSSLRIFGCACWPNLRPYNTQKLQFRSKECLFLGYSNLHKGFKCLDPSSGRVYISRDVVFDENIFPFSKLLPNVGPRLRSEVLLLPPSLLNPTPGHEHVDDHRPNATDHMPGVVQDNFCEAQEENLEENGAASTTPASNNAVSSGGSPEADPHPPLRASALDQTPTAAPGRASSSDQAPSSAAARALPLAASPGQLPHATRPGVAPPSATHSHPGAATSLLPDQLTGAVPAGPAPGSASNAGGETPGSFAASPVADRPAASDEQRPHTCLRDGIRKPRVYTDGTVRYGLFTSTGEPHNTSEALADNNWKNAMDIEYNALIHNKTWHLVPPQKGRNVIDCK